MSSSAKLAARSGGVSASAYAASQKRNAEKGRPGSVSLAYRDVPFIVSMGF